MFYLLLIFLYFVPSMVAYGKQQFNQIVVLNLFLGWTGIGWVASLVWALSNVKE